MAELDAYSTATKMDACDREALMTAALALQGPQAALEAIRNLMVKRYGLGPMDTLGMDGTIMRHKPEEPAEA